MKLTSLSGIFYELNGSIWVESNSDHHCISEILDSLVGTRVQMILHHEPDLNEMTKWGAGSCLWESTGRCPFGHHQHPAKLLHFDETGFLQNGFQIRGPNGVVKDVPMWAAIGHKAQIIVLVLENHDSTDASPLWDRATDLMSQLNRLQNFLNKEGA